MHALTRTDGQYIIPYDKSFFAGGSTSLRAWQPRRLGPGSYTSCLANGGRDYITEQPGELLLEGSAEYRFPIYSFIKGAFFTDFGNVWGLQERENPNTGGLPAAGRSSITSFYRQIAVGSGLGIRFDFTFLILRLDLATRIFDPTAPSGRQWALRYFGVPAPIPFPSTWASGILSRLGWVGGVMS